MFTCSWIEPHLEACKVALFAQLAELIQLESCQPVYPRICARGVRPGAEPELWGTKLETRMREVVARQPV